MKSPKNTNYRLDEAGRKVFTIICKETQVAFEHVQMTRGRPPLYCPEVRQRKALKNTVD